MNVKAKRDEAIDYMLDLLVGGTLLHDNYHVFPLSKKLSAARGRWL
jgi:hypothetical protein